MDTKVLRATQLWQKTGAFHVRIHGMGRQHNISLRQEFDDYDSDESTKYIVLLDNEYPVATCRFYELDSSSVMLGRVVVIEEYRKKGLGRKTIEEAEKWIKELGYSKIVIESRIDKTEFYDKLGYVLVGGDIIKGDTFVCIKMEKSI